MKRPGFPLILGVLGRTLLAQDATIVEGTSNIFAATNKQPQQQEQSHTNSTSVNARAVECPLAAGAASISRANTNSSDQNNNGPIMTGYVRIDDLLADQEEELERIQNGILEPRPPYTFVLCPNTILDVTETTGPLKVLLSGATFQCGNENFNNNCVIRGASREDQQVVIETTGRNATNNTGYKIETVRFVGVTFDGRGGSTTSIRGIASSATTAYFVDTTWESFGHFLLHLEEERGGEGMTIEISRSVIKNCNGDTLLLNNAGTLLVKDLLVTNVMGDKLLETTNNGTTILQGTIISESELQHVTFTTSAATQIVQNCTVTGSTNVDALFHVEEAGSSLFMRETDIRNNRFSGPKVATAVRATNNATATVTTSTLTGNTGVSDGFRSSNHAHVELIDVEFLNNTGLSGALTALVHTDDFGTTIVRHSIFLDNSVFTGHIFALSGARVEVYNSCIESGGGDTVLFFSHNSLYIDVDNYVSPNVASMQCRDERDGRLVQEDEGSGCFNPEDPSPCSIGCKGFGTTLNECGATTSPTLAPSTLIPTLAPSTLIPTLAPTTTSPTVATTSMATGSLSAASTNSSAPSPSAKPTASPSATAPIAPLPTLAILTSMPTHVASGASPTSSRPATVSIIIGNGLLLIIPAWTMFY